jgi:hypothetical protein
MYFDNTLFLKKQGTSTKGKEDTMLNKEKLQHQGGSPSCQRLVLGTVLEQHIQPFDNSHSNNKMKLFGSPERGTKLLTFLASRFTSTLCQQLIAYQLYVLPPYNSEQATRHDVFLRTAEKFIIN